MLATRLPIRIAGFIASGALALALPYEEAQSNNEFSEEELSGLTISLENNNFEISDQSIKPPLELELQSDRQEYDSRRKRFVAEGNAKVSLNGGVLQADRIEFDNGFNTLYALGSVRYKQGSKYFQASSLRYSLVQKTGELKDVYGVIDLKNPNLDFLSPLIQDEDQEKAGSLSKSKNQDVQYLSISHAAVKSSFLDTKYQNNFLGDSFNYPEKFFSRGQEKVNTFDQLACPPKIPPVPDWQPYEWALTGWGGQMFDSSFGNTFVFKGRWRPEYLLGIGLQKKIFKSGVFSLELETDFFAHQAYEQEGGEFNQSIAFADSPAQSFGEGILGLGAKIWVQPWLSFGIIEGLSYYTKVGNYEKTYREKYSQLLNYLGFEIEMAVNKELSLVGRIHHRSGAFGIFNGAHGGGNGYLVGLRYRWGESKSKSKALEAPPPLGCPGSNFPGTSKNNLGDNLEEITMGNTKIDFSILDNSNLGFEVKPREEIVENKSLFYTNYSKLSPSQQEVIRAKSIAAIDQRISSIEFQRALTIERRLGVRETIRDLDEIQEYGAIKPYQLNRLGKTKFIRGRITRWRIQASKVFLNPDGWQAERMGFTNDPYTPAQTRIDAEGVVAKEQANGDLLITSQSNSLVLDERLPIPISRRQLIQKEEEVENRWVVGIDNQDRDGLFIGRNLRPIKLTNDYTLYLQPQLNVQRSIDGRAKSYVAPNSAISSSKINRQAYETDSFGLEAVIDGRIWDWDLETNADISTFNLDSLPNGSRYWGDITKSSNVPFLGSIDTRIFGAYRYRAWNGSLGQTDIYSAYGSFLQKRGDWEWGEINNNFLWRLGAGNYQAKNFTSENLSDLWRLNFYGSISSRYSIIEGDPAELSPEAAYRYSPEAVKPGLIWNTNLSGSFSAYGDGKRQNAIGISGGPTLTIGTFSRKFLGFTRITVTSGGTYKEGSSPFSFDQAIDLGTLGIGLTQQVLGPLVFDAGFEYNIDPGSDKYGEIINSNLELRWQRRSYDFGLYFNPYEGIGGFRVRLNDFKFNGTGVPFIPYDSTNSLEGLEERPY